MIKPSFAVAVKDGKPVILECSLNADDVINAYKSHQGEAYAFIRPSPTKSKTEKSATVKAATPVQKVTAKK